MSDKTFNAVLYMLVVIGLVTVGLDVFYWRP
jgi:nitrogen fixation-related uncharacterized protein